jgi:hypothetical protein
MEFFGRVNRSKTEVVEISYKRMWSTKKLQKQIAVMRVILKNVLMLVKRTEEAKSKTILS